MTSPAAQQPKVALSTVWITITSPTAGSVSNPVTASGGFGPSSATVTCWFIHNQTGQRTDATVTTNCDSSGCTWQGKFGTLPTGPGTIRAKAVDGGSSDQAAVGVTVT